MRLAVAACVAVWLLRPVAAGAQPPPPPADPPWQFGGFADAAYLLDAEDRSNTVFRSRGTTWHLNAWHLNMAGMSVKRSATDASRWGIEAQFHAGKDAEVFGFSATAPTSAAASWLRHAGPVNLSYRAPAGNGLTLQGGIFSSLIGYDSLYAKDNFTYTRPWGADFTPYLMMGVNAAFPITSRLTSTVFVVNGYWHLAHANDVPSTGAQFAYRAGRWTIRQTVLTEPHQQETGLEYWRHLSDTIVERRTDRLTTAVEFHAATETVATIERERASWAAAQAVLHWTPAGRWSVTLRPEVAHDSRGRWTLARQTVKAFTATLEGRLSRGPASAITRLEYRVDTSTGPDGGFLRGAATSELKRTQHLLIGGVILTFDTTRP